MRKLSHLLPLVAVLFTSTIPLASPAIAQAVNQILANVSSMSVLVDPQPRNCFFKVDEFQDFVRSRLENNNVGISDIQIDQSAPLQLVLTTTAALLTNDDHAVVGISSRDNNKGCTVASVLQLRECDKYPLAYLDQEIWACVVIWSAMDATAVKSGKEFLNKAILTSFVYGNLVDRLLSDIAAARP